MDEIIIQRKKRTQISLSLSKNTIERIRAIANASGSSTSYVAGILLESGLNAELKKRRGGKGK